jgi:hypothetical protein
MLIFISRKADKSLDNVGHLIQILEQCKMQICRHPEIWTKRPTLLRFTYQNWAPPSRSFCQGHRSWQLAQALPTISRKSATISKPIKFSTNHQNYNWSLWHHTQDWLFASCCHRRTNNSSKYSSSRMLNFSRKFSSKRLMFAWYTSSSERLGDFKL